MWFWPGGEIHPSTRKEDISTVFLLRVADTTKGVANNYRLSLVIFYGRLHTSTVFICTLYLSDRKPGRREHSLLIAAGREALPMFPGGSEPFSDLPEAFRWYRSQFYCAQP
jgi:hypothetical protein